MKLKAIAAAALVASAAFGGSANAGTTPLGSITNSTISFSQVVGASFSSWDFTFSLTSPSDAFGYVEGVIGGRSGSAVVTSLTLFGPSSYEQSTPTEDFSFHGLAIGDYTLRVFGSGTGKNPTIVGEFTASSVPEASTLALMMAGLGVVGFVARRRKAD